MGQTIYLPHRKNKVKSERKVRIRLYYLTWVREGKTEAKITTAKKALSSLLIFFPCVGYKDGLEK